MDKNFNKKLWLVKVPELIHNKILKEKNDIGMVEVFEKENEQGKKELIYKINLGKMDDDCIFDLNISETKNFFIFKEKKNVIKSLDLFGRLFASDERTSDKVTLQVANEEADQKPKVNLHLGKGRQNNQGRIMQISEYQFIATADNIQKAMDQKIRKDKNLKKTRKDRDELKTEIFGLFSNKNFWTNREIVAKLDQPENYLKEVLSEICNYIKSGPKKGCYELKRQYVNIEENQE
jgi:hypothetical protein